jgi:hypothetical protein
MVQRTRFERGARDSYTITGSCAGRSTRDLVIYKVVVPVPYYDETRIVTITLHNTFTPILDGVTADGPTESPHRYDEYTLCMWRPRDPVEQRWVYQDGLLKLVLHTQMHLFREAWWRETSEWLGEEAPHGPDPKAAS